MSPVPMSQGRILKQTLVLTRPTKTIAEGKSKGNLFCNPVGVGVGPLRARGQVPACLLRSRDSARRQRRPRVAAAPIHAG